MVESILLPESPLLFYPTARVTVTCRNVARGWPYSHSFREFVLSEAEWICPGAPGVVSPPLAWTAQRLDAPTLDCRYRWPAC